MTDEPSHTRWSFKDFKTFYDAKFGGKRDPEQKDAPSHDQTADYSGGSSNGSVNGNGSVRNTSDMAIYEQFRNQEKKSTPKLNGVSSDRFNETPPKPLFPPLESVEMRALAESLCRDIIRESPDVKWESIKGLENAKRLLKEAVVMPIKYPKYFTGLLSPWKGILLFGPPGTGKVCSHTLLSLINVLKFCLDGNIDLLLIFCRLYYLLLVRLRMENLKSSGSFSEYEQSPKRQRVVEFVGLTSMLVLRYLQKLIIHIRLQMDGLTRTDELVFVLAATNLPWELDAAMLRRLEKRILVPLPEPEARRAMFGELLPSPSVPGEEELPYDVLVERTEGYSGSDIRLVCKEAAMQPLRRLMVLLEDNQEAVPEEELPKVGPIRHEDIEIALKNTRPSAYVNAHRYEKFNDDYGSQIIQ
ncbi:katanin p60 ATPase-containing subunit A-like 2 [Macadamia integrifolia]|uniref:katanin p60 ATPase-containing subunit A-like 2 n=1 Tax=Macadamia integrifolia TaxID=60698 RepID=UPI001C5340CC|nr:katanin p60 ATPase-containing subunit A-like 2 [Macadamia integrifolia]